MNNLLKVKVFIFLLLFHFNSYPISCVDFLASRTDQKESLQVTLWKSFNSDGNKKAELLEEEIRNALKNNPILKEVKSETGSGGVSFLYFENGMKGVFTPDIGWPANYKSEVAAYIIDRIFGFNLVPVTVFRKYNKSPGSIQFFIEEAVLAKEVDPSSISRISKIKLDIFDSLILNKDRHHKNAMIIENGEIVAIDNSLSFGENGSSPPPPIKRTDLFKSELNDLMKRISQVSDLEIIEKLESVLPKTEIENFIKRRKSLLDFWRKNSIDEPYFDILEHRFEFQQSWEI